jgi:hypothetical protein
MKQLMMMVLMMYSTIVSFGQETLKYSDLSEKPSQWKFEQYESKDGYLYKVGDKIKIGVTSSNKTFAFIFIGDNVLTPVTNAGATAMGQIVEIKSITYSGSRRVGFSALLVCKGPYALSGSYRILLENAIETGEVKGLGMTSDEALSELKKCKDKLELGLITQEEFDSKKSELSKSIK